MASSKSILPLPLPKQRAKPIPQSDWAKHRKEITKLYIDEGKPLDKVMAVLSKQGFRPRKCQYKNQFELWKLQKNQKHDPERVNFDDLLDNRARARRWMDDSRHFSVVHQFDHEESIFRHLLLRLGFEMLHKGKWNLLEYAGWTDCSEYQLGSIWDRDSVLRHIMDDLCITRPGIISVFYWLWKVSEVMHSKGVKYTKRCKHFDNYQCGSSIYERIYTPICETMLESSAAAPRLVVALLLASKRANEGMGANESSFVTKCSARDGVLFEWCLSRVKDYFPNVYAYALELFAKFPEDCVSNDSEEDDWQEYFEYFLESMEVTCNLSMRRI